MSTQAKKVVVGMSGGVDSAVAAWLLRREGCEVVGVTLRTWSGEETSRCCEIDAAAETAQALGIEFRSWNVVDDFNRKVIEPFVKDYRSGLTPNPCVECNRRVKWEWLVYIAGVLGADRVATGHYARLVRTSGGRFAVKRAADNGKDQSYMLYQLTQEQLAKTVFPLGEYSKAEVRRMAGEIGLEVAAKKDSQEICFAPSGDYAAYIEERTRSIAPPGNFVDENGNVLGRHRGIIRYTVGQRRGLDLALGYPVYVKRIDAAKNEVVIGAAESLYAREIFCRDLNFMSREEPLPGEEISATVKIRYQHVGSAATLVKTDDGLVKVVFPEAVRASAPGQSAVFYDETGLVIGGGKII